MAYEVVSQGEQDAHDRTDSPMNIPSRSPPMDASSLPFQPLSNSESDNGQTGAHGGQTRRTSSTNLSSISQMLKSFNSASGSYEMVEEDDYDALEMAPSGSYHEKLTESGQQASADLTHSVDPYEDDTLVIRKRVSPEPMVRRSSEGSVDLRHPKPDLQSLQGAYIKNVEKIEASAERLSITSNLEEELRKLKAEQKLSDSRRSSLLSKQAGDEANMATVTRQLSYGSAASSILATNTAARSGGYSPGGYLPSPKTSRQSSFSQPQNRPVSKSSRWVVRSQDAEAEVIPYEFDTASVPKIMAPPPPRRAVTEGSVGMQILQNMQNHASVSASENNGKSDMQYSLSVYSERAPTMTSTDTHQQPSELFADFDGVHYVSVEGAASTTTEATAKAPAPRRPALRTRPQSYVEPTTGQEMVYYPAPVPRMLNLPQRLSRLPPSNQRDMRRSQILGSVPEVARNSALWLSQVKEDIKGEEQLTEEPKPIEQKGDRRTRTYDLGKLPPQLRASAFFDHPSVGQEVEIQGGSAVATLESILDASARAPVSAFTDHPIVGNVNNEVYRRDPTRRSTLNVLPSEQKRKSSMDKLKEARRTSGTPNKLQKRNSRGSLSGILGEDSQSRGNLQRRSSKISLATTSNLADLDRSSHDDDMQADTNIPLRRSYSQANATEDVNDVEQPYINAEYDEYADGEIADAPTSYAAPTTLLAELQMRKQRLKERNRTAATAFPRGMHASLLDMDAVAQVEKESRRNKRVTLAWEAPHADGEASDGELDEDVPLGVLFPGQQAALQRRQADDNRPLGLLDQRELEENEPLSARRNRLAGKSGNPDANRPKSPFLIVPGMDDAASGEENEGETLAQRIRRLKSDGALDRPKSTALSSEFASELMSQLGIEDKGKLDVVQDQGKTMSPSPDTGDEHETLAQRRKRLQQENAQKISKRRSLADILSAHPAAGAGNRPIADNSEGLGKQQPPRAKSPLPLLGNSLQTPPNEGRRDTLLGMQDAANQQRRVDRRKSALDLLEGKTSGAGAQTNGLMGPASGFPVFGMNQLPYGFQSQQSNMGFPMANTFSSQQMNAPPMTAPSYGGYGMGFSHPYRLPTGNMAYTATFHSNPGQGNGGYGMPNFMAPQNMYPTMNGPNPYGWGAPNAARSATMLGQPQQPGFGAPFGMQQNVMNANQRDGIEKCRMSVMQ